MDNGVFGWALSDERMSDIMMRHTIDLSTATRFETHPTPLRDEVRDREIRRLYDPVLREPVPASLLDLIRELAQKKRN